MHRPKHTSHRKIVQSCAKDLGHLVRGLERSGLPPLGPAFSALSGTDLADALIGHRACKYLKATKRPATQRRQETVASMLAYDSDGLTTFDYRQVPQPYRGLLLQAKCLLAEWLSPQYLKRSHRFRPPSGETAVTSHGEVDLLCKLQDSSQWNVSLEASWEAAAVCYHNVQLKRLVRQRYRASNPFWRDELSRWRTLSSGNVGFKVFHRMFVSLCNILNVSRLSTVPKDGEKDRPISMEPLWNMVAQLSYAGDLRSALSSALGITLERTAELHRTLIRHADKATIDFANASNSNWLCVLEWLLPRHVFTKLSELRTPVCEFDGEYHYYNMLAPMGCGFTFEVMTIVLLALARVLDRGASVFGDDVIIDTEHAETFVALTAHCGWKVNNSKSFVNGNFRESCGGFHDLSTRTDLLSYDFKEILTEADCTTTANKLYRLLEANQCSLEVRGLLLSCYCSIIKRLPHDVLRRSSLELEALPEGVALVPDKVFEILVPDRQPSKIERLVAGYWHTPILVMRQWETKQSVSRAIVRDNVDHTYYLCYLRRGKPYEARNRSKSINYRSVIPTSGTPLATVPLFSFI